MTYTDHAVEAEYFAHREKVERLRAEQSTSEIAAAVHTELAQHYAAKSLLHRSEGHSGPPMSDPIAGRT